MRKAGQYCIQIYDNAKSENSFFDRLNGAGMLRPVSEEMRDFYELVDGEQYSEEYGLDLIEVEFYTSILSSETEAKIYG